MAVKIVKIITGKFHDKAVIPIRPVISAFDSVQGRSSIIEQLDQLTVPSLESCVQFLGIALFDKRGFKTSAKPAIIESVYLGSGLSCPLNVRSLVRTKLLSTYHETKVPPFTTALDFLKAPIIARGTECCTRHYPK